jgi:large subunit ribosomal protein L17
MRHLKAGRRLSRNASHRRSLFRNLTLALIRHERIITTVEKAKELRPFVEKLITLAKKGTLHARRLVIARLGSTAKAELDPDADETETLVQKLFKEIGPRFADRPGGYTRIIKRPERRLGDAGRTAYIELLKAGEKKVKAKAEAPAPRVTEPTPAPAPAPAATPEPPRPTPETPQAQAAPAPEPPPQ